MGEDASIDGFGTTNDENENANEEADDTSGDAETGPDSGDVTPTVTTYGWTPRNAICAACGDSAERRWRDDGEMVCSDCKEW